MSLRHPYNMLPTGLPSNFNSHNPISIFSTPGIRNFGPLDGSGHLSSSSNLHSVLGSGIPGLAATSLDNDTRNYDQRRREFYPGTGIHDHHVKREEVRTILCFNFHCHHYNYIEVIFYMHSVQHFSYRNYYRRMIHCSKDTRLVLQYLPVCNCTKLCMDVLESSESTCDAIDLQGTICFCRNVLKFSLYLKRSSKMV